MFISHNRYYANFYYCTVTLKLKTMSKLSLSGVNQLISLLFCDPSKPIYEISGRLNIEDVGNVPVSIFSNQINVPETVEDVHITKLNRVLIGNYLNQLKTRFMCDSFSQYIWFVAKLKEFDDKKKEDEKDKAIN